MDNETIALNHPEMSDQDLEEVFACKALAVNPNAILQNVRGFEMFTFAVNGIIPNEEAVDIPNVLMLAYAVKKAEQVLGKKLLFSEPADHTVIVYIAHCCYDEGWVLLPKILSFAQHELDKITTPYGKQLFKNYTVESLEKLEPFDDEDPVSNHALKLQTLIEYLKIMEK